MRVLVTGAAGNIGTAVCRGLVDREYDVVGVDRSPEPELFSGSWYVADCADPDEVEEVFNRAGRIDALVHLAGRPDEASLPEELTSHVVTTAVLLEAMVRHNVPRIVYASSNHAVGLTPRADSVGIDVRPRPDSFYGVAKVSAEALLSLYADRYGIDAIATRIGSFLDHPETRRNLSTWLSHDDAVRMFDAALTTPDPRFRVIYGISANTRAWWDLAPGRAIGYEPHDDAEAWADQITATPTSQRDDAEAGCVGGPVALPDRYRPAL